MTSGYHPGVKIHRTRGVKIQCARTTNALLVSARHRQANVLREVDTADEGGDAGAEKGGRERP